MEDILHLAKNMYTQYLNELFLGLLVCIFLLMILTLLAVKRCRKQIRRLSENTKEMTKIVIDQSNMTMQREQNLKRQLTEPDTVRRTAVSREDEELFGSVIQEIFP